MQPQPVPVVQGAAVYGQPPMSNEPYGPTSQVVVNQVVPVMPVIAHTSQPFTAICPNCKVSILTNSDRKFNCCTCCLCCWTGLLIYLCIQCCREKDFCCYDAVHTCPRCGGVIANYQSC